MPAPENARKNTLCCHKSREAWAGRVWHGRVVRAFVVGLRRQLRTRRCCGRAVGATAIAREAGLHGDQGGLAGVNAGQVPEEDPRLSLLARVQHVVESGRELQDRRTR